MQISDSYKKREGKGSDANELFVAFLLDSFVINDLIIGNRKYGLPDCYTKDFKVGFEITRVGYTYDFERESITFGYTNSTFKDLDKKYEFESLKFSNNYVATIEEKFRKLSSGNYNLISDECHLVVFDFDRLESQERIKKIISVFEHFSKINRIKFSSLYIFTTSSIKNYCNGIINEIRLLSTEEFNALVDRFKKAKTEYGI